MTDSWIIGHTKSYFPVVDKVEKDQMTKDDIMRYLETAAALKRKRVVCMNANIIISWHVVTSWHIAVGLNYLHK